MCWCLLRGAQGCCLTSDKAREISIQQRIMGFNNIYNVLLWRNLSCKLSRLGQQQNWSKSKLTHYIPAAFYDNGLSEIPIHFMPWPLETSPSSWVSLQIRHPDKLAVFDGCALFGAVLYVKTPGWSGTVPISLYHMNFYSYPSCDKVTGHTSDSNNPTTLGGCLALQLRHQLGWSHSCLLWILAVRDLDWVPESWNLEVIQWMQTLYLAISLSLSDFQVNNNNNNECSNAVINMPWNKMTDYCYISTGTMWIRYLFSWFVWQRM